MRHLESADAPALVTLNDAAHPAVPITSADEMRALLELAGLALGLERDGALVGFVIAMHPGAAYASENFRWFEARGTGHVYVDRIVVAESERGRGLGPVLYDAVFTEARRLGHPEVTCEVNLDPPNPGSLAFHSRLGFVQVGTQATKGGSITVALMAAPVER
nr:GNAT family N-acetyltransferase [Microcella alkalica]